MLVSQSCLTLCDPMDYSLSGSSVLGILQARTLEWMIASYSLLNGIFLTQGSKPGLLHCSGSMLSEPAGKPHVRVQDPGTGHKVFIRVHFFLAQSCVLGFNFQSFSAFYLWNWRK